ncbi:HIT domain-containing protein [archaeon]|nr:MAG: HIT domain-containing protein [archaeon]
MRNAVHPQVRVHTRSARAAMRACMRSAEQQTGHPSPCRPCVNAARVVQRPQGCLPGMVEEDIDCKDAVYYHKSVCYDAHGHTVWCRFCRIAKGEEVNQLWYQDERVSVFVPHAPCARLHLLVIPNHHIRNMHSLTREDVRLLEHMRDVALLQLRAHGARFDAVPSYYMIGDRTPPPTYEYPRGALSARASVLPPCIPAVRVDGVGSDVHRLPEARTGVVWPAWELTDDKFFLCFHRPPNNSVDHLHLHAIYLPYLSERRSRTFRPGGFNVAPLEEGMAFAACNAPAPPGSTPVLPSDILFG